jgi:hypothetical protein
LPYRSAKLHYFSALSELTSSQHGIKNVITLFHKPSYAPSTRVLNLLKQSRANAAVSSTIDQAAPTPPEASKEREDFELDVQEAPPTEDQLKSILEYVGSQNIGDVVKGAMTEGEAMRVFERDKGSFARPLVSLPILLLDGGTNCRILMKLVIV